MQMEMEVQERLTSHKSRRVVVVQVSREIAAEVASSGPSHAHTPSHLPIGNTVEAIC